MVDENKIPKRLSKKEFRFVLLKNKCKTPFEINWTINNYEYSNTKLIDWIKNGNNYGIIGGYGGLIILDFDDIKLQEKIIPHLPKTFTVKTGTGKLHKYFICDNPKSFKVFSKNNETLIDIQGEGKQVVAPNSVHPNGNKYVVEDDSSIAKISFQRLQILFNDYLRDKDKYTSGYETDPLVNKIKEKVDFGSLLNEYGYNTESNLTMCKLGHSSRSEQCFSFNIDKGLWHCFNCDKGGDIFNFIMEHEKCDFKKAKQILMGKAGIKHNFQQASRSFDIDYIAFAEDFYENQPFFYDSASLWWIWNFELCCWERIDKTDLMNSIYESTKEMGIKITQSSVQAELKNSLEMVGRKHTPKKIKNSWVQFKDKIYDLASGDIFRSTPEYFNTNPIPWDVGDSVETPEIDKIFSEWVGEEKKELLFDITAYCMLQDYPLHRIFCLVGSGCNGKSVFLTFLEKFIGSDNCATTELDSLLERFGTSVIYKKLVCTIGETNFNQLQKTSLLKKMSGGDSIDFEFKGKDRFKGKNYATLLIATNNLPTTTDKTDGFYRRWVICKFPNKFNEKQDVMKRIKDIEFQNLCLKSLHRLKRILEEREIKQEGSIEERKEKYEQFSNPLVNFINERCYLNPEMDIPVFQFYEVFTTYLEQRGYRKMSKKEVSQKLQDEQIEIRQIQRKIGCEYKNWRYYVGIGLKDDDVTDVTDVTGTSTHFLHMRKNELKHVLHPLQVLQKENNQDVVYENISTQYLVSTLTKKDDLDLEDLKIHIENYPKDNIDGILEYFGKSKVEKWLKDGEIIEMPKGSFKIL